MRDLGVLPMEEPPGLPPAESDEDYRLRLITEGRRLRLSREQLNQVLIRRGVEPLAIATRTVETSHA